VIGGILGSDTFGGSFFAEFRGVSNSPGLDFRPRERRVILELSGGKKARKLLVTVPQDERAMTP